MSDPSTPAAPRVPRALGLLVGVAALLTVIGAGLHLGDAQDWLSLVEEAHPGWLVAALGLQALTYGTEVGVLDAVLRRGGAAVPLPRLYLLALVGLFTSQSIPSAGLAGTFVILRALEAAGVPPTVAVSAVLVELVGYYAAYGLLVGVAMAVLQAQADLPAALLPMAAAIVLLGLGVAAGALWLTRPGASPSPLLARLPRLRALVGDLAAADPRLVRRPGLLAQALAWRGGNFLLDAATLWTCLRAVDVAAAPGPVLAAFMMGSVARTLGLVPGGLGTFEAATTGGLALFGVAVEPALAAVLLFRGLSFWLPGGLGLLLSRRLLPARTEGP